MFIFCEKGAIHNVNFKGLKCVMLTTFSVRSNRPK